MRLLTTKEYIERAKKIHGNKYIYDEAEYINATTDLRIICPIHGPFYQKPHVHLTSYGCPYCSPHRRKQYTNEEYISEANRVHNFKYDYSKTEYSNMKSKIKIICHKKDENGIEHGEFVQNAHNHLCGSGCPKCGKETIIYKRIKSHLHIEDINPTHTEEHLTKIKSNELKVNKIIAENNYGMVYCSGYSDDDEITLVCKKHGQFTKKISNLILKPICQKCALEKRNQKLKDGKYINKYHKDTKDIFIEKARKIFGDRYIYDNIDYINSRTKVEIVCRRHGSFWQTPTGHLQGNGCRQCGIEDNPYISNSEIEIKDFFGENNIQFLSNDRDVIDHSELDIYSKENKIAIEFDGLYWHNEINKPNVNYHLEKTEKCNEKGITLIHIFEDEWIYKKDIVKSRLKHLFGLTKTTIYARKCEIKEISSEELKSFLEDNHIQGNCNSSYRYGLYYNGLIVSVMSFSFLRKNTGNNKKDGVFELTRFCNKINTNVVGGASKLLKHFIKSISPKEIISYCDRRWSNGKLYQSMGFVLDHISKPNYFYIIRDKRYNRFNFRKDILVREGYDKNKSEHEIMLDRKIYRIYDCGNYVFKLILTS